MIMGKPTRSELIKSFDHSDLLDRPHLRAFREALNNFANDGHPDFVGFLDQVRDLVLSAPFADYCDCGHGRIPHGNGPEADRSICWEWPIKIESNRGWLTCSYVCGCCGNAWTCGYSAERR